MLAIDQGTKAYLAGVLDMAGVIRLRPRPEPNPPLPYVGVSTPNKQLAEFLAGLTDSKVTEVTRKFNRHLCTEHCPADHSEIDSVTYRWSVTGVKATVLLANIKPYLVFKTPQANEALTAGLEANYKAATYGKMRVLGWEIPEGVKGRKR